MRDAMQCEICKLQLLLPKQIQLRVVHRIEGRNTPRLKSCMRSYSGGHISRWCTLPAEEAGATKCH